MVAVEKFSHISHRLSRLLSGYRRLKRPAAQACQEKDGVLVYPCIRNGPQLYNTFDPKLYSLQDSTRHTMSHHLSPFAHVAGISSSRSPHARRCSLLNSESAPREGTSFVYHARAVACAFCGRRYFPASLRLHEARHSVRLSLKFH